MHRIASRINASVSQDLLRLIKQLSGTGGARWPCCFCRGGPTAGNSRYKFHRRRYGNLPGSSRPRFSFVVWRYAARRRVKKRESEISSRYSSLLIVAIIYAAGPKFQVVRS